MSDATQQSRTKTVGVACTPSEKRDVQLVVDIDEIKGGESALLRDRSLNDVLARAREIRADLAKLRGEAA